MPKAPLSPQEILLKHFAKCLLELMEFEKQLLKLYPKLEKAAHTAELVKALNPEVADQVKHINRLKLITNSLNEKKPKGTLNQVNIPLLPIKASIKSAEQDLILISFALQIQNLKLGYYEFLHPLAAALQMETEAALLEQTITDNRNTNTWLRQIIQNIIAPSLKN
ncbi:DUF892 family protein [Pedobacter frigiditerrae]|uniref:DUF892 family protein n=1 Tax=Pedobacter frigiditerrae TaxID=2530452 RepID=A0A4R0MPZ1_9SPHI|nr:DUF892 family protein [Pedobacter frigiditerrae]TCC88064.1 DUF892 family protein [Pedobacter frigiditerrae]